MDARLQDLALATNAHGTMIPGARRCHPAVVADRATELPAVRSTKGLR